MSAEKSESTDIEKQTESQIAPGIFIPVPMTAKKYAQAQGVTTLVIENQIRRGYLPTIKRGKYRLINTFAIARECLAL